MKKLFKFIWRMIWIIILLCVIAIIWAGFSIHKYAECDETQQADAAIVLGCAVENGEPTPVFRERINHAIRLYHDGYVKYLLFTGGVGEDDDISEAMAAKKYAVDVWHVPEDCVFIEEKSHITEENLKYAREIMEENNLESALLVSDPLHMKRAMLMAKDYGVNAYSSPTTTSLYQNSKAGYVFLAREAVLYIYYGVIRIFI